jgi:hypothetical protein
MAQGPEGVMQFDRDQNRFAADGCKKHSLEEIA